MKATYHSYWIDKNNAVYNITAKCDINTKNYRISNLMLNKSDVVGMRKLFDCVMAGSHGYEIAYGSPEMIGWNGAWLDKNTYKWLKDAKTAPVQITSNMVDLIEQELKG